MIKSGNLFFQFGDNEKITYWRSTAKSIQALPVIYSGAADKYKLTDKEIEIMVSSQNGEQKHVKSIYNVFDKINLDEGNLLRGAYPAFHKPAAEPLAQNKIHTNAQMAFFVFSSSWKHSVASINLKVSFNFKY